MRRKCGNKNSFKLLSGRKKTSRQRESQNTSTSIVSVDGCHLNQNNLKHQCSVAKGNAARRLYSLRTQKKNPRVLVNSYSGGSRTAGNRNKTRSFCSRCHNLQIDVRRVGVILACSELHRMLHLFFSVFLYIVYTVFVCRWTCVRVTTFFHKL